MATPLEPDEQTQRGGVSEHDPEQMRAVQEAEAALRAMAASVTPFPQNSGRPIAGGRAANVASNDEAPAALPRDALWHAERRYRALVEQIPVVTFLAALDFNIQELYVSPQIETLLGFTQEEWLDNPILWYTQLYPEDRDRWQRDFAMTCATGAQFQSDYRFFARDGRIVWVHGECQVIRDENGAPLFLQGVAYDITKSKEAEAALQRMQHDLEDTVRQRTAELARSNEALRGEIAQRKLLEEALQQRASQLAEEGRQKDQFLAVLAHELRNPLAPLATALELLRFDDVPAEERTWAIDMMGRQVGHMTRLIDDLLDISRVSRGKIVLRKETIDAGAIARRAAESIAPLVRERKHELSIDIAKEPLLLDGDAVRLEQIMTNLLTNAVKYTEPGGRIFLLVERDGDEVVTRVRDSGAGIPAAMLEKIFELFMQVDTSLSRPSQWGLGIGLALVRGLVDLHGGTVKAFSEGAGRGSEFVVRLPAQVHATEAEASPVAKPPARKTPPLARRRILVVEDNREFAKSLSALLRSWGQDVLIAGDGPAALASVAIDAHDVAILDIGLPGMDGYDLAKKLRERPGSDKLFLIALTGYGREEDRQRAFAAGFNVHLTKPVTAPLLHQVLERVGTRA